MLIDFIPLRKDCLYNSFSFYILPNPYSFPYSDLLKNIDKFRSISTLTSISIVVRVFFNKRSFDHKWFYGFNKLVNH